MALGEPPVRDVGGAPDELEFGVSEPVAQLKPRRKAALIGGGMDQLTLKVGIVMGEITGIKAQIAQGDAQRTRLEDKIDKMPDALRATFAPLAAQLAEGIKAHSVRLDAHDATLAELKQADAVEKGSIQAISGWKTSWKAKLAAMIAAFAAVGGTFAELWGIFHK